MIICFSYLLFLSLAHAQRTDRSIRKTFELTSAFEFYSNACESFCGVANKISSPNVCPKCSEHYSNCNHCCSNAASSLKIRWHGICEGDLTIATAEEIDQCKPLSIDAQVKNEVTQGAKAGFILCSCYDSYIVNGYLDDGCIITNQSSAVRDEDFCIVSITDRTQIDFTQPLPNPLILKHISKGSNEQNRPDMNQDIITAIDTACGETEPPLFPGYGKFAGTCSSEGTIDLGISALRLPPVIDYYSGNPPTEMFWYEFMDGTSTGFWPSTDALLLGVKNSWFNPTFASCSCTECPTSVPSASPTQTSSISPSDAPSQVSTIRNTRQEVLGCPSSSYESCNAFSQTFCIGNGQGSVPFGEACFYSPVTSRSNTGTPNDDPLDRKLQDMESLVEHVQQNGLDDEAFARLHHVFDHDQVAKEEWAQWLQSERDYHLRQYNELTQP